MASYERFDDKDTAGDNSAVGQTNMGPSEVAKPSDVKVVIAKPANIIEGRVNTPDQKQQQHQSLFYLAPEGAGDSSQYITDPAGDPLEPKTVLQSLQVHIRRVVEHIAFRLVTVILIIVDFIFVVVDLASCVDVLEKISHVIISYFLLEVALRIFCLGRTFFYNWLDVVDMLIVLVSFVLDMVFAGISTPCEDEEKNNNAGYIRLVVIGRVVRIVRLLRLIYLMINQRRHVQTATRRIVSQNKRRFQRDGFDLDLCYITERIIAMSFPSTGLMAFYRNPIEEVARFFNTKHRGHYRIYNLCSERDYDETLFFNNVERVYIDDHNVPKLKDMLDFTENVRDWMAADPKNVIAIHCKGGKGRTGTMICVWLIDSGIFEEAQESLQYFGDRRTDLTKGKTFQGVETPSQSRYVGYYEKLKNEYNRQLPPRKVLKIQSLRIESIGNVGHGDGSDFRMELRQDGLLIYECNLGTQVNCKVIKYTDTDSIAMELENCPNIEGDIKIMFHTTNKRIPKDYDNCPFYFWFHTSFINDNRLYLSRDELDNPHKKKRHHLYKDNFAVELKFEEVKDDL
ncbi:hypothetical protein C0Q70_05762 [Pomacea canaliculata]|uniref:Phosphatidylinositol-3,4,5-trisphosphate 3-phosphatase n=1 Tax=Pomacea canaliculata TaxID=400727 RepID=A0A2T7PM81_POMCA|nr:phosphatidylinositol 3,4,5-trisphosphate 3-phosphatase TPTE2-like isoform X2 [Pomacea canaliculata]PVD34487.1 hypothetical protein C0Q70_05762 [Pomacea canaliculata]